MTERPHIVHAGIKIYWDEEMPANKSYENHQDEHRRCMRAHKAACYRFRLRNAQHGSRVK